MRVNHSSVVSFALLVQHPVVVSYALHDNHSLVFRPPILTNHSLTHLSNSLADLEALMRKRVAAAAAGGKGGAYGGQAMYTLPIVAVTVLLPCAMLWFKHGKFPM